MASFFIVVVFLSSGEASKTMDYKSVFTNLCLELQQNRSWIKGLGKNPQKSELIHLQECLLSGGTEACSLGLRETPACIHVIQRLSQPRVACWHGFQQNSQKTECVFTRCPTGGRKKIACIYGLWSEGVKHLPFDHVYQPEHLQTVTGNRGPIVSPCYKSSVDTIAKVHQLYQYVTQSSRWVWGSHS